jgi:hypothetical protein
LFVVVDLFEIAIFADDSLRHKSQHRKKKLAMSDKAESKAPAAGKCTIRTRKFLMNKLMQRKQMVRV